jgi:uncharacterized phage protein gp47/JayE
MVRRTSLETRTFDSVKSRAGTVLVLWSENWNEVKEVKGVIPRSVQFTEKGENLVIFGLESGVM